MNMRNLLIEQFWAKQTSSLHRLSSKEFYEEKANEHADLIHPNDQQAGAVDLGCGAGELLEYLIRKINIEVGIDYSSSMINAAKERLKEISNLKLIVSNTENTFNYLNNSNQQVWTTTGALNQYLEVNEIYRLIDIFKKNKKARSFYLFDCVDPIRYNLMSLGISYLPNKIKNNQSRLFRRTKYYVKRLLFAIRLISGFFDHDFIRLGSSGMGYGHLPSFWLGLGDNLGIRTKIVSSRIYEYRFHVIYTKD